MTPEAKEKKQLKAALDSIGAYHHWPVPAGYGKMNGLDCYACIDGTWFALEVKAPGESPTARQKRTIEQIIAAGGNVVCGTADYIIIYITNVLPR